MISLKDNIIFYVASDLKVKKVFILDIESNSIYTLKDDAYSLFAEGIEYIKSGKGNSSLEKLLIDELGGVNGFFEKKIRN